MTVINLVYTISTKQHSEPDNTAIVFFYRDYGKEDHLIDIHFFFINNWPSDGKLQGNFQG